MKSVIKGTGYILVHVPDMVLQNGTTQTTERIVNPESEYLKELPQHLRSYEDCKAYYPNQVYIGNYSPEKLEEIEFPWYDKKADNADRYGKFGEIMPGDEFLLLMQISDEFELVKLESEFLNSTKEKFAQDPVITEEMLQRLREGETLETIKDLVEHEHAEGLYFEDRLVGCVKRAHDIDPNLSSHVMMENLVAKASSVLALCHAIKNAEVNPQEIEYVIDCCEEACGDMNQRGGGNFAKATAEIVGLSNATGSDVRGFCAAPGHAVLEAAALVASGVFKTVAVSSGGCTAKLGMNGKDHLKKGVPILEDCLGGFSVIVTADDGVSPVIDLEHIGRHSVGTGSAPQAVMAALVTEPLTRAGLSVLDIDKYSPEMQNPDVTKPAGAGDVPLANFKMIAALGVKMGQLEKADLNKFIAEHGLIGYAPTQGHIPSGAPYIGFACENIKSGKMKRVMIIGKGSLFLGRLTNLFDGVTYMIVANDGNTGAENGSGAASTDREVIRQMIAESLREFAGGLLKD